MSKVNVLLLNWISLALENVLRLNHCLLRISLSDLELSSGSLTLTFIMSSKARASGNILTCQRKFSSCPSSPIQVFNDLLSWEKCGDASWPRHRTNNSMQWTAAQGSSSAFKEVQAIIFPQQKQKLYLCGLTLIFLGCDHGTETFTLNCAEFCADCPGLALPPPCHAIPDWKRPMAFPPPFLRAWTGIIVLAETLIKAAIHVMGWAQRRETAF